MSLSLFLRVSGRGFFCAPRVAVGGGSGDIEGDNISLSLLKGATLMTALRQRMIRELELHRKSAKTIQAYVTAVAQLAAGGTGR
jgi:hypothetical protein